MKNILLRCTSGKFGSYFGQIFDRVLILSDSFSLQHLNAWLVCSHEFAGCLRQDDFDFLRRNLYFSGNIFKLHPDCKHYSSPCAPSPNLTDCECSVLKQVNLFHLPTCGIISALSFWGRGSAELESDEKSSFWKGKKLLPVQFCSFKEEGDCVCGVTCHPFKLQGIPVAWVLALPVHFLPMNAEYSHSIP